MLHHLKRRPNANRRMRRERERLEALRLALGMYPDLFSPCATRAGVR